MEFENTIQAVCKNIRLNIKSLLDVSELKSARKLSLIMGQGERYVARVLSEEREITFPTVIMISKIFDVRIDLLCVNEKRFIALITKPETVSKLVERTQKIWTEYKNENLI